MSVEPTVMTLPSARGFIDDISEAARTKSVVVLIPDTVSRDMVARLINNRLDVFRIQYKNVPYSSDNLPAIWLSDQLNVRWPSPSTSKNIRNLLLCGGLPELIHVHDFNTGEADDKLKRERWLSLIHEWVRESGETQERRYGPSSRLCLVAKLKDFDFQPPEDKPGLSVHWWWGFPSSLEMRLACRISNQEETSHEAANKWREQVLPALVGSDMKLAEHLWNDVLDSAETIIHSLREYARLEGFSVADGGELCELKGPPSTVRPPCSMWKQWSKGAIVFTNEYGAEYHPALLANCGLVRDIERRLWRGQAEFLLPILNEIRIAVCDELTQTFGADWPTNPYRPQTDYELEAVEDDPRGAEFGHIENLLKYIPKFRNKTKLLGMVSQGRMLRNEIAHYRPVSFREFDELWNERERLRRL